MNGLRIEMQCDDERTELAFGGCLDEAALPHFQAILKSALETRRHIRIHLGHLRAIDERAMEALGDAYEAARSICRNLRVMSASPVALQLLIARRLARLMVAAA